MIPVMAVSRGARAGCRTGLACSCARISGDALTRAQESEALPFTAMDDCVRARVCIVPLRTPAQLRQLQFHCGKPPPAAAPSTLIFIAATAGEEGDATPPAHAGRRHSIWSRTMFNQR